MRFARAAVHLRPAVLYFDAAAAVRVSREKLSS